MRRIVIRSSILLGMIIVSSLVFFYSRDTERAVFNFPDEFTCLPSVLCEVYVTVYNVAGGSELQLEGYPPQGVSLEKNVLSVNTSKAGQWPLKLKIQDKFKKWKTAEKSFILKTNDQDLSVAREKIQQYILTTSGEKFLQQLNLNRTALESTCTKKVGCRQQSDEKVFRFQYPMFDSTQNAIVSISRTTGNIIYAHGFPLCVQMPSECIFLSKEAIIEKARVRQKQWADFPIIGTPHLVWLENHKTFVWNVALEKNDYIGTHMSLSFDANDGTLLVEVKDIKIRAIE